jgi:hypothetical protein
MSNAYQKHLVSELAKDKHRGQQLVPRNGGVETQDAKFGRARNAISRCAAATSGSPATREAHLNQVVFPNDVRRRLTQWLSTSLAETIRVAERHL